VNAERWSRLQALFDEALATPAAQLCEWMERACDGDPELRAELEELLDADAHGSPLLDGTAEGMARVLLPPPPGGIADARIGPYRILREIGRGGMGTVYLGVRDDVGKRAALKLVRGGLAAPENVDRLLRERRVLAAIEHPNIAALLDAGTTTDGLPYFAMEYVEGEPIDAYCDRRRLVVRERLALAEAVCAAVAHAHARGIVHRDLKPSNILVRDPAEGEDAGQVKLLDFGIARVLEEQGSTGELTRTGVRIMTPEVAAPEQVRGDPVSPATDVYMVGVLLYRLLTGHSPYPVRGRSLGEIERAVLEQEPAAPSQTVLRGEPPPPDAPPGEAKTAAALAELRASTPERLRRELSGDLDHIVLQALEKDPGRRYATAAELLDDLRRYREGLPVRARASTAAYRVWKWARRRRGVLAVAAVALAVLGFVLRQYTAGDGTPVSPGVVIVLPFEVAEGPAHGYLGEGMISLLGARVNASTGVRAVDPRVVLAYLQQVAPAGPQVAGAAARHFAAEWYVTGEVRERGGRVELAAALYRRRPGGRDRRIARPRVEGAADSLVTLVDRLADEVLLASGASPGATTHSAALSTRSLLAMRWYLEGEAAIRAGRQEEAVQALQQAVAHDSTFALAYLRLSSAATWVSGDLAARASSRAAALSAGLPREDSLLIHAWYRHHRGDVVEAERLYREVLGDRPDDVDAWYQFGELLYHWGPSVGRPATEARSAFERVLLLDPGSSPPRTHLVRLAALERRFQVLDTLATRALAEEPEGTTALEVRAVRAYAVGDTAGMRRVRQELAGLADDRLHPIVRTVVATLPDPGSGLELARLLTDPVRAKELRVVGRVLEAQLLAAAGRPEEARRTLAVNRDTDLPWTVEYEAALAMLPFAVAPRDELRALRDTLATLGRRPANSHAGLLTVWNWIVYPPQQTFALAMLEHRMGEDQAALRRAEQLVGIPDMGAAEFRSLVHAHVLAGRGRRADALAALGAPGLEEPLRFPRPFSYSRAYGRWLRAELLRETGRGEEALRWYATFPDPSVHDLMFVAPSHLRRAQIHDARGERELARLHYARFVELWRDAEPPGQVYVERARRQLER
jgi:serine/threonine protein kinase/tetratricopeptide (TPR) repeat protein